MLEVNYYPVDFVCKFLDEHGIGYHVTTIKDCDFVYIDHGAFGRPAGKKIKKHEFRPDFRITVHDSSMTRVYTKVCGATGYMKLEDILDTLKAWEAV